MDLMILRLMLMIEAQPWRRKVSAAEAAGCFVHCRSPSAPGLLHIHSAPQPRARRDRGPSQMESFCRPNIRRAADVFPASLLPSDKIITQFYVFR